MYCASEDCVAAEQTGEEGIVVALLPCGRGVAEEEHGGFVDKGEEAEVARVLPCGFVDEPAFRSESVVVRRGVRGGMGRGCWRDHVRS